MNESCRILMKALAEYFPSLPAEVTTGIPAAVAASTAWHSGPKPNRPSATFFDHAATFLINRKET